MEKPTLNYLNELTLGDESLRKKIVGILQQELPIEVSEYKGQLNSGNLKAAAELVHKIKHKISILGYEKGYALAIKHEENLLNSDASLRSEFDKFLQQMSTFVQSL